MKIKAGDMKPKEYTIRVRKAHFDTKSLVNRFLVDFIYMKTFVTLRGYVGADGYIRIDGITSLYPTFSLEFAKVMSKFARAIETEEWSIISQVEKTTGAKSKVL